MAEYQYVDSVGTIFDLTGSTMSIQPVETIDSGSAEPRSVELAADVVERLIELFQAGFKNRTFRVEKRTLESAQIRCFLEEEPKTVYLALRSPEKNKIEALLQEVL